MSIAVLLAACGGTGDAGGGAITMGPPPIPARAATAGDALLPLLPEGADVIVELDLARLRGNAVVGDVVSAWLGAHDAPRVVPGSEVSPSALRAADVVVLAAYQVGTADAATLTLIAGGEVEVPGARVVRDGVLAIGPDALVARVADTPTAEVDPALRALRAAAMPAHAEGAVVRVTGRLSFDARVALASMLGADVAPATLSVWGDVADDLAVVAKLDGGGERGEPAALRAMVDDALDGVASVREVRLLGLAPALRAVKITSDEDGVDVVALVGPRRLARAADRARAALSPSEPLADPKETE